MDGKEKYVKKRLPAWLKAMGLKLWFYGAVYFFVGWGLMALSSSDQLDLVLVLGLTAGAVNDLAVNRILLGLESSRHEYRAYIMFPGRDVSGLLLNLLYGTVLSFFVANIYNIINILIIKLANLPYTAVPFGAEPIMYGLFMMLLDVGLIRLFRRGRTNGGK